MHKEIQVIDVKHYESIDNQSSFLSAFAAGSTHDVLTDIYQENINMTIWKRELTNSFQYSIKKLLDEKSLVKATLSIKPQSAYSIMMKELGESQEAHLLSEDIALLVDMFCCLFDLKLAGLRLSTLDKAMCPKFHVDRVPCRLVTTYHGCATQWLPNTKVNRNKLGLVSAGKTDETSGLFKSIEDINNLHKGDVALLKGELWQGNEGKGLIHRSPCVSSGQKRLFLSLDFA